MCSRTSRPLTFGSPTSSSTRSNLFRFSRARARAPSFALSTEKPAASSIFWRARRRRPSSSAIRIFFIPFPADETARRASSRFGPERPDGTSRLGEFQAARAGAAAAVEAGPVSDRRWALIRRHSSKVTPLQRAEAEKPRRVFVVDFAQNPLGQAETVDPPAPLGRDGRRRVIEVLVLG